MDADVDLRALGRFRSMLPSGLAEVTGEEAGRVAFVMLVTIATTLAFLIAGIPAWVFAVFAVALAGALWLCWLELSDQRREIADIEHHHALELHELRRQHQVQRSAMVREAAAAREESERLLADLRAPDGDERARVLEYRFLNAFGASVRDLERRGYCVRVEGDPPVVRAYRRDEVKAEVPLRHLLPPHRDREAALAERPSSAPVSLEPSLERL